MRENEIPEEYCCSCTDDCGASSCVCAKFNRFYNNTPTFCTSARNVAPYVGSTKTGKCLAGPWKLNHHIFECGKKCSCNKEKCRFSLLSIYNPECEKKDFIITRVIKKNYFDPSRKGYMWGVVAGRDVAARSLVMKYTGELITEQESNRRGATYDQVDKVSYIFGICMDINLELVRATNFYYDKLPVSSALAFKDFPLAYVSTTQVESMQGTTGTSPSTSTTRAMPI